MSSWIQSANTAICPFPIYNLPYGVFSREASAPRCGVAIGDLVLDLAALESEQLLPLDSGDAIFSTAGLNDFMALGPDVWHQMRERLIELLLDDGDPALKNSESLRRQALNPMSDVTLHMPFKVDEYTDFYAGRQHAFNVGSMFRGPENALPPNWLHIPIGYNGRASTVVVSGTDIHRPLGQSKPPGSDAPVFGPCQRLDIELEIGAVVGQPSQMGRSLTVDEAEAMIFGYVLLNDWSARDIQTWEYQPLGPFQAKAFATTISPWVVTKAALEPFRTAPPAREIELLPYLVEVGSSLYDIRLEVVMQPQEAASATTLSQTNSKELYYTAAQQLAHHASGGCAMNVGDLLGSGTISGAVETSYGSLLEMSWNGTKPLTLDGGEFRSFIEDGDTLTLSGWAQGEGYRIGFGDCSGKILPARTAIG